MTRTRTTTNPSDPTVAESTVPVMVHCDLKMPNMMQDANCIVRVMDFGIAKQYDAASSTGATQTGHIVGTPGYVSPEQARKKPAKTKIGILLWNAQVRYQQCRDGVIDELRQQGFPEPQVAITVEHADANGDRVTELARRFVAAGMSVIVPVGTSASVRVAAEIKDIPVVFAFTFDPVASGIAQSWKSSGNNTTGSSSKTPAHLLLRCLRQLSPVKRLAVLYTPEERNTEAQLADFRGLKDSELQVIPAPIESQSDIAPAVSRLEGTAEALLLTGSSLIGDNVAHIVLLANKARMITATQSHGLETRVLLGVTVNPTAVGRLSGKKCAMVLRGAKPASIEIEALETFDVTVHLRMAKGLGLNVPEAVKKAARLLD